MSVNLGPCLRQCLFCAFAECNDVFKESTELPIEYVVEQCRQFESDGANAIYLMATGVFPFDRFLEYGAAARDTRAPETLLIANVVDFDVDGAKALRDAGFGDVYHVV